MRALHRRSRTGEDQRGSILVEFVLVIPIILIFIFGLIDFAFLLRDKVAVSNIVRDASRTASTNPRVGNLDGHWGAVLPAGKPSKNIPSGPPVASFAFLASQAVEQSGSSLRKDSIRDMWVYLANPLGFPTQRADWKNDTNTSMTCLPAYCVRYAWIDATDGFRYDGASTWAPKSINACPRSFDSGAQAVGVYIRYEHLGLYAGLFNTAVTLSDRSVVKFEPMRTDTCSPVP